MTRVANYLEMWQQDTRSVVDLEDETYLPQGDLEDEIYFTEICATNGLRRSGAVEMAFLT